MDRVVDYRFDSGLDQGRNHPHVKGGFRRKQDSRRLDPERLFDDPAMPLDLLDDVAIGDQRHQRVVEADLDSPAIGTLLQRRAGHIGHLLAVRPGPQSPPVLLV